MMCNFYIKGSTNFRVVLLFIGVILIVSVKSAPSKTRRDSAPHVETLQVSKVSQVDEDDGEVWYPTIDSDEEYSMAKDRKVQEPKSVYRKEESVDYETKKVSGESGESYSTEDSDSDISVDLTQKKGNGDEDWIQAITVLFKKFGFHDDQIPEPFGSQKSQSIDMPSPEFGLILQGLIAKTPASLNEQLKEILHAGGITDLDSKSQDKTTMLKKIDKTVTEIREGLQGSSKESKFHEDSQSETYSSKSADSGSDFSYDGEVGDDTENENSISVESENSNHEELVQSKDTEVNELHDEHRKHKEEMLDVIRKLSETSQGDKERLQKIEDIIEQIDRQHYRELELESKLENLAHEHGSTADTDDAGDKHSQTQTKETEELSLHRFELDKNPTERLSISTKKEIKGNDEKKNHHKTQKKSQGSEHTRTRYEEDLEDSQSGENLDNSVEFTEKIHHVKKIKKGAKHKEKSMQDSKETQFADIRKDSLKPFLENTSTEKAKNSFVRQSADQQQERSDYKQDQNQNSQNSIYKQDQNSQNSMYSNQDDYDNRISIEENIREVITEKPLPLASVSFKHRITNVKPVKSSRRLNSQNTNSQQSDSYALQFSNSNKNAGNQQRTSSNTYKNDHQNPHHHVQEHGDAVIDISIEEGNQQYA